MTQEPTKFSRIFAYARFSSEGQADGNSLERQRQDIEAAVRQRFQKDEVAGFDITWLEDHGLSAYHGEHVTHGWLGDFMDKVRTGKLPKNCLFVCETVSRASRQGGFVLLSMVHTLLEADFSILMLQNGTLFNRGSVPKFLSVELALYAELAREESAQKQRYSLDNWERKRRHARERPGQSAFTGECPNWLEVVGGKYRVISEKVDSIRDIYLKTLDGYGIDKLVRYANQARLPVPGKGDTWHTSLIKRVLNNRALIGEFQPHRNAGRGKRLPEGEPIAGFYPVAIAPDLFFAVQSLQAKATTFPSRRDDNNHNYLMGIAKCECGGSWRWMNKDSGKQRGYSQYGCSNRQRAVSACPNVNGRLFDHTFVTWALDRIPELLSSGDDPRRGRILSLEAQFSDVSKRKAKVRRAVEVSDSLAEEFLPRLRELVAEEKALQTELDDLKSNAAPAAGFSFEEAAGVFLPAYLDVFETGTPQFDDAYRARSLFRSRIVQSVARVDVSMDRTKVTVKLRNDKVDSFEIEDSKTVTFGVPELTPDEWAQLDADRSEQLRHGRRMSNANLGEL
ncbi:hypothetical protein H6CHR_00303 [Variovorax sp. PBL-H6]|uniref:recombinase family protein n=1 Tax=Variovorax sp. PBL-H6 TaxID=434009 RepID=UPI001317952F|nr:recombinase family protein [Variovorax sp. PBL-H6]VTU15656.1 hypothetical protein H6CHR_00303 [Variovorax sp. PBL-H6]